METNEAWCTRMDGETIRRIYRPLSGGSQNGGTSQDNKRIYVTKKQNYVYYERTDVNWNYWSSERNYNSTLNPENDSKHNIIFEVSSELSDFIKYLGEEIMRKIELKQHNGEIVEILDI